MSFPLHGNHPNCSVEKNALGKLFSESLAVLNAALMNCSVEKNALGKLFCESRAVLNAALMKKVWYKLDQSLLHIEGVSLTEIAEERPYALNLTGLCKPFGACTLNPNNLPDPVS